MSKIKYIIKSITLGTIVGGISGGVAANQPVRSVASPPQSVRSPTDSTLRVVLTQNIPLEYLDETPMTHILRGGLVGMFIACNVSVFPYWGITSFTICSCYAIEKSIANGYLLPASHTLHARTKP
jgi:hypothetical protein